MENHFQAITLEQWTPAVKIEFKDKMGLPRQIPGLHTLGEQTAVFFAPDRQCSYCSCVNPFTRFALVLPAF